MKVADWQAQVDKLLGIGHAANPIMALHQVVTLHHLLVGDTFGVTELIADHFKHQILTLQGEHHHHQPGNARGIHKLTAGTQGILQFTDQQAFAVLVKPQGVVEF